MYHLNKVIKENNIQKKLSPPPEFSRSERIVYEDNKDFEFIEFDRITKIKSIINKYGEENFYLSFSGGRDSTILHQFLDIVLPENKIPRVFINTGIEYVEIVKFVKCLAAEDDRIQIIPSGVNIRKLLDEKGYPVANKNTSQAWYQYRIRGSRAPYLQKWMRLESSFS